MREIFVIAVIFALVSASRAETALDAVKKLPKGQVSRIARIEARGGTPEPDRWYILTQDPSSQNGVHEFVVSEGEVVASRSLSQFTDSLTPDDILGFRSVKFDSNKAETIAHAYADANGAVVTSVDYELKKNGPGATPAWTISCLDDKGKTVGYLVITAGRGNVVSHDGFALAPKLKTAARSSSRHGEPRFETYAHPEVAPAAVAAEASPAPDDGATGSSGRQKPAKKEGGIAKTFQNMGRTMQKYLDPF